MQDGSGITGRQATPELIERLDAYVRHFTFAAIVVNLGSRFAFVLASAPDRLTTLTRLVEADGTPLGIVASSGSAQRRAHFVLAFSDYTMTESADTRLLLSTLCEALHSICKGHLRPRPEDLSKN